MLNRPTVTLSVTSQQWDWGIIFLPYLLPFVLEKGLTGRKILQHASSAQPSSTLAIKGSILRPSHRLQRDTECVLLACPVHSNPCIWIGDTWREQPVIGPPARYESPEWSGCILEVHTLALLLSLQQVPDSGDFRQQAIRIIYGLIARVVQDLIR